MKHQLCLVPYCPLHFPIQITRMMNPGISRLVNQRKDACSLSPTQITDNKSESSVPAKSRVKKGKYTKMAEITIPDDELRPEYDETSLKNGIRGKYAQQYAAGTNMVRLAPDVAAAYPNEETVNEALRLALETEMSPLEEIQNAALDTSSDLGTLLRKCKLLAARLGSQQLEDWLIWESTGYPEEVPVPGYRVWGLQVRGNFVAPYGSSLEKVPIPPARLPKEVRKTYNEYKFRLSIATIESMLEKNNTDMIQINTNDLSLNLNNVYQDMDCLECWGEFSPTNLVELLNTVRNRILDFSLAVWKEHPKAGETNSSAPESPSSDKITQIFNMTVHGGTANLVGTANNSSVAFNIGSNDFESVRRALQSNGVSEQDITELERALAVDKPPQSPEQFGPKVSSWIAGMMKKASEGTWSVGIATAGNLLAKIISEYYGL